MTGPGGVGKTRLAGEMARRAAPRFADGACSSSSAAVRDPEQVPATSRRHWALSRYQADPSLIRCSPAWGGSSPCVVLDNCETCWPRWQSFAECCWQLLMTCGYSQPAGSLSGWPPKRGSGCRRCRSLDRTRNLTWAGPRWPCSRTGPGGPIPACSGWRFWAAGGAAGRPAGRQCRSRSSWPRPGLTPWNWASCWTGWSPVSHCADQRGPDGRRHRHRSLAATVEWSYQLLDVAEQRAFRRWPCSPARSPWTPQRRWPGKVPSPGGAGSGRLLAAGPAPHRPGRPDAVPDAGSIARVRTRPAHRGRRAFRKSRGASSVRAGHSRAGRGAQGDQRRGGSMPRPVAGRPRHQHAPGSWASSWCGSGPARRKASCS